VQRQVSFRVQNAFKERKNILRKTFVTSDKWKGAARRVKMRTQVRCSRDDLVVEQNFSFFHFLSMRNFLFFDKIGQKKSKRNFQAKTGKQPRTYLVTNYYFSFSTSVLSTSLNVNKF
jgi:chemotaxis methyl-accepting protein methylase